MLLVPLAAVPAQTLSVVLAGQSCDLSVYTLGTEVYFDLVANGASIVRTRICRNVQRLLLDMQYRGFVGDFEFIDTQGANDPQTAEFGSRYFLVYLEAADL